MYDQIKKLEMEGNSLKQQIDNFGIHTLLGEKAIDLLGHNLVKNSIVSLGCSERFDFFKSIPVLNSALSVLNAWDGHPKTARAWSEPGSKAFQIFAERHQIKELYEAGFLVVLENIERFIPELQPLCRALEFDLSLPQGKVNVEIFCGKKGCTGRAHFDHSFTFNCQLIGTKKWKLAENKSIHFPTTGMFLDSKPPAEISKYLLSPIPNIVENYEEFVASSGDVIFVAPGVIHETYMESDSLAIAFAIEHTDSIAKKISEGVRLKLQNWPELRAARLGGQFRNISAEMKLVAFELRKLAGQLDGGNSF